MLVLAAILTTAAGLWVFQSVFFQAVAKLPRPLQEPLTQRFAVDPYIWTEPGFRPFRRRYALSQGLIILGLVMWALIALPYRADMGAALALLAGIVAVFLLYRLLRHGL
jgi:hypothetical protein